MMDPCVSYCFTRFGKEYNEDCDKTCNYAKITKERDELRDSLDKVLDIIDSEYTKLFREQLNLQYKKEQYAYMYYEIIREAIMKLKGE